MPKDITLTIDGQTVTAPAGTLVVDAAKRIGINIPVFCYHPKLEPVGMCRMCLVEIGRPVIDRTTNNPVFEADGKPKIQFGPKLETACTTPISEGMVVVGLSDKVKAARKDVLEFLLTSHPLDCPICDKGGECPLQNQTLEYGSADSRFLLDEKMRLSKHVPLGDLIFLDRERCIQCARCVRFQTEIVDDPVIGFYNRGRKLEIITDSQPGFDSIFSGNTTDICPVGALTTADFRFGARPWEMNNAASLCTHCPVGCNTTINVRREAKTGGNVSIKRIMPRQNETVNEIWMCDKGRFAYHFADSPDRLKNPLIRKGSELFQTTWTEALSAASEKIKQAGSGLVTLASGRLTNEDIYNLRKLTETQGGTFIGYSRMAGGEIVNRFGMLPGSNLGDLGKDSVIVVVSSDLHEEAPIWWLRVREAVKRGAVLISISIRPTRLDKIAAKTLRVEPGREALAVDAILTGDMADIVKQAKHLLVFYGSDGLGRKATGQLAAACARLLETSGHARRINSGLIPVWERGNTQGLWDMGAHPADQIVERIASARVLLVAGADPANDDPMMERALEKTEFLIVQDLFATATARKADIVFPVLAFTEREGTYTSGERRVQRFYPAVPAPEGLKADYEIAAEMGAELGLALESSAASLVFQQLAAEIPQYSGLTYPLLAKTSDQWPIVGRPDVYFGGTSYANRQGLGIHLPLLPLEDFEIPSGDLDMSLHPDAHELAVYPVTRLLDRGITVTTSPLLASRLAQADLFIHPATARKMFLNADMQVMLPVDGAAYPVRIVLDETVPEGAALIPRSAGVPIHEPQVAQVAPPVGDHASRVRS
ncbi:NADH-quinone oxidoreductase subunit NuoG [Leptolinea tardivitalis]|uniref:NADH-quinone oxidoreductase subunit NuoG n=1 Tax=Leptolinea tardivitalis TaxID=229920 RepID=UPI000780CF94|nr:NADH-quinone oxidoreductase subunit NuoG [Leptolinea tardivitalis]GAP22209.1 NADH-quinone oxidoreductase, chain G [Leptolinea tardivitalis]